MDELVYNKHTGCYEGETSGGQWVSVSGSAMAEARHIAAMSGESKTSYWGRLLNPDIWVSDPNLQDLEGVEVE